MSLENRKVGVVMAVCVLYALGETATAYRIARWCKRSRPWIEAPLKSLVDDKVLEMTWGNHRANTQKRIFEPREVMVQAAYPEVWAQVLDVYGWPSKLAFNKKIPSRLMAITRLDPLVRKHMDRNSAPALKPLDPRWQETLDDIFSEGG